MRVLMLTPDVPQPTGGGAAIRNWYILQFLAEVLGAQVQLITFGDPDAPSPVESLPASVAVTVLPAPQRDWRRRLQVLGTSRLPDLADRLWSAEAQARIVWQARRTGVDLVHVGGLELGRYALEVSQQRDATGRPALVLDAYNAEYVLQRRACHVDLRAPRRWPVAGYSATQWRRLRAFEQAVCRAVDAVVCVSQADAAALARLGPIPSPAVIPNGADVERYQPQATAGTPLPRYDLVFSGTFDYRPNIDAAVWLAHQVWPLLRARLPALTLALVGRRPSRAVQALSAIPGVTVTGAVVDDRPYLWGAGMYVVPMRYGGGVRLKLLNALAAGCPVVSTTMGAEGVNVEHGRDVLLADTPEQWVRVVGRVLQEPGLRERLAAEGRALVAARYHWPALVHAFADVYQAALSQPAVLLRPGERHAW